MRTGRLAPTPSGHLHLGNVVSFTAAWLSVRQASGRLLLRIEDVDAGRARADIEQSIRDDLVWLGLTWDDETPRQSERDYTWALAKLNAMTYRCQCTRALLVLRPCPCRHQGYLTGSTRFRAPAGPVHFVDRRWGACVVDLTTQSDPVLVRSDGVAAYTLAVVADDVADGVTEVVRGADLLEMTGTQLAVWAALGVAAPTWLHAPLILGSDGRKLSKSHHSTELRALRAAGWRPADVWSRVLPWIGLAPVAQISDAVASFDPSLGPRGPLVAEIDP